jgi:hypothetical protein
VTNDPDASLGLTCLVLHVNNLDGWPLGILQFDDAIYVAGPFRHLGTFHPDRAKVGDQPVPVALITLLIVDLGYVHYLPPSGRCEV